MSINISGALARISDISVTVHMNRLTKGQQASVKRQIERGVVLGSGVAATIAKHFLELHQLPFVRMSYYGYVSFKRVPLDPAHPLREALITANAASAMADPQGHARRESAGYGLKPSVTVREAVDTDRYLLWFSQHARNQSFKNVSCNHKVDIPDVFVLPVER